MNWWKTAGKVAKHAALAGAGAAVGTIQAYPAGSAIDWQAVITAAIYAAIVGGIGGGGINAAKHIGK